MTLLAIGISHKTASAELRGKCAISEADAPDALLRLCAHHAVHEAVVLSTCNRTEVYAVVVTASEGTEAVVSELVSGKTNDPDDQAALMQALYVKQGASAIEHLFRVVSSLDSLVLGEAQIIGQVRHAFSIAQDAHTTGEITDRLFKAALEVGKRVRSQTEIGARSVSVATVAAQVAKRHVPDNTTAQVLVVGAGEMGALALGYLYDQGLRHIVVVNRTLEHAHTLAQRFEGRAAPLDHLEDELVQADIVIASAAAQSYVIDVNMLSRVRARRGNRPLCIVDVALPRTVDPACGDIEGVMWYDLDSLGSVIDEHAQMRAQEAVRAMTLVSQQTDAFLTWLQQREVTPTIKHMHDKAQTVCEGEVARAVKALAGQRNGRSVDELERAVLESLAQAVAKKLLHGPTARLRKQAGHPEAYRYTEAARYLFGLDAWPQGFSCHSDEGRMCRLRAGVACARHTGGMCPHGTPQITDASTSSEVTACSA